jgi:hypothetical protein
MSTSIPIRPNRLFEFNLAGARLSAARTRTPRPAVIETVVVGGSPHPNAPIQYTQAEITKINHHLRAASCVIIRGEDGKTPIVRGIFLDRSSPFSFTEGETYPAEAVWDISNPTAPKVHPSDEACVLLDLETAPQGLLANIELTDPDTHQTSGAYVIKGQYLGHSVVIVYPNCRHTHTLESIAEELTENGVLVQQIILSTFLKSASSEEEEETFAGALQTAFPTALITEIDTVRNVIIGRSGVHIIKASCPQEYFLRWGEETVKPTSQVPTATDGHKLSLGDLLKQTIENLAYEYAKQNGAVPLTAHALQQILVALQNSPLFKLLAERYVGETNPEALAAWPHVFNLLLAPLIMPQLIPSLRSESQLVTNLHSYYYAFSHFYRQYAITGITGNYAPGYKMQEIVEEIAAASPFDPKEMSFLKIGCAYFRCHNVEHTIEHDTYIVVNSEFRYYSSFPFLSLSSHLDLLSVYGGYGHNSNPKLLAAMRKRGLHELVAAEFIRAGSSSNAAVHSYSCVAGLIERLGFEPFARILHVESYRMHLGGKIVNYLLPAIARQVTSSADLSVPDKQSLLNRYVAHFDELPESCSRLLPSLSRFVSSPTDLDPSRRGSLGNYLAGIARLPGGKALLSSALPAMGHLITSIEDLNPCDENSFCRTVLAAAEALGTDQWGDEKISWWNIYSLLPHLDSPAELLTLLGNIDFWNNYRVNIDHLLSPLSKDNQWRKLPCSQKAYAQLAGEIICARTPSFSAQLTELLAMPHCMNKAFAPLFAFLDNKSVGLKDRFRVVPEYMEIMGLFNSFVKSYDEMDLSALETILEYYVVPEHRAVVERLFTTLEKVNSLLSGLCTISPLNSSTVRRQLGKSTEQIVAVRRELLAIVLERPLTEQEQQFMASNPLFKKILRLVSLVFSLSDQEEIGLLGLIILKQALQTFFATYDAAKPASEALAYQQINQWLYGLDQKTAQALLPEHSREVVGVGNQEARAALVAHGYSEELWTKGIDITVRLDQGLTAEEKRAQIISAAFELVELAISLGLDSYQEQPVTLDLADSLNSFEQAAAFAKHLTTNVFNLPEAIKSRIGQILEGIKIMDNQPIVADLEGTNFRIIIQKDFFVESSAGVGVPGCFDPNGGAERRMPLIHGAEVNAGFVQIFNDQGLQIANAVLVYTTKGAYVLPNYSFSAYDLHAAYAEALAQLTEYVPAVLLRPTSAGFSHLHQFARRKKLKIEKPPVLFGHQAFDEGTVDEKGQLTIEDTFAVVTKETLAGRKSAAVQRPLATRTETFPQISWQALANQLLTPDYDKYPFLREIPDPKQFLPLVGQVKRKISSEGQLAANQDFYHFVAAELRRIQPGLTEEICDEIADLVIDFLEDQRWPIVVQTLAA